MSTAKKTAAVATDVESPEAEAPQVLDEDATNTQASEILDNEIERLIPGPGEPLELSDGTMVEVNPLKIKELFAAFKIITRGAAMTMGAMSFDVFGDDQDNFIATMVALLINAFPEADQEFCEFLRILVSPVTPTGGWKDRDEQLKANIHLDLILLDNPDIGDALDLITVMVSREAADMQRLGKKVANAAKVFAKVQPKTPLKK